MYRGSGILPSPRKNLLAGSVTRLPAKDGLVPRGGAITGRWGCRCSRRVFACALAGMNAAWLAQTVFGPGSSPPEPRIRHTPRCTGEERSAIVPGDFREKKRDAFRKAGEARLPIRAGPCWQRAFRRAYAGSGAWCGRSALLVNGRKAGNAIGLAATASGPAFHGGLTAGSAGEALLDLWTTGQRAWRGLEFEKVV